MPNTREKLIELLAAKCMETCMERKGNVCSQEFCNNHKEECTDFYADHLISNGVTVQKWIPVSERLPDLIPCGAGTAYSEAVNVLTSGRKVLTAIWDGTDFIADAEFWEAENEEITHWTPVLLPLPEPPKEGLDEEQKDR